MNAATVRDEDRMRHRDWMQAAEVEYARLLDQLSGLSPDDWSRPTDCVEWDVHDVVAHLVGAAESTASMRELLRQQRLGKKARPDADDVDGMNAVQVQERKGESPAQLIAALRDVAPRAIRGRRRIPAPLRVLPIPFGPPLGTRPLGYLMGRIYTRDAWMHRVDIARATGAPLVLDDHDARIVADVVAEWARAHGHPFRLVLTGPAGGSYERGTGGEQLELDAVEFARVLAGRERGEGLLRTTVPF